MLYDPQLGLCYSMTGAKTSTGDLSTPWGVSVGRRYFLPDCLLACSHEERDPAWLCIRAEGDKQRMGRQSVADSCYGWYHCSQYSTWLTWKSPPFLAPCNSGLPFNLSGVNLCSHGSSSVTGVQISGLEGQTQHQHHSKFLLQPPSPLQPTLDRLSLQILQRNGTYSHSKKNVYCCKGQSSKLQFNRLGEGLQTWSSCPVRSFILGGGKK